MTRWLRALRGMMATWMRWRRSSSKANRARITTASGTRLRPAIASSTQYPTYAFWNGPRWMALRLISPASVWSRKMPKP